MDEINGKLKDLEQEKEELAEFEQLDKARRSLEYNIHSRELEHSEKQLQELEQQRVANRDSSHRTHSELQRNLDQATAAEEALETVRAALLKLSDRKEATAAELAGEAKRRARLEAAVQEAEAALQAEVCSLADTRLLLTAKYTLDLSLFHASFCP